MKIAIIATSFFGGGRIRAMAYKDYLQSKNYYVNMLTVDNIWPSKLHFLYKRACAYLNGKEPKLMEEIANRLESKIRQGKYDVVIGVESLPSYVLTRDLDCLKIFSWEAMVADEFYFESRKEKHFTPELIRRIRAMELEICQKSDYVVFPWETTENYARKNLWNGSNFMTIRYGCYPKNRPVAYFFPPSIVSVGGLGGLCQNAALLSYLTNISPYTIDAYGSRPDKKYKMNYKGIAPSLDVFYNYQFGLNTLSKDVFRRSHFSSRVITYLAYGLPVLSPDWMQLSHDLKGCVPYNEDNFVNLVDKYSEKQEWARLSESALAQAHELDWNNTLKPLEKIITK